MVLPQYPPYLNFSFTSRKNPHARYIHDFYKNSYPQHVVGCLYPCFEYKVFFFPLAKHLFPTNNLISTPQFFFLFHRFFIHPSISTYNFTLSLSGHWFRIILVVYVVSCSLHTHCTTLFNIH